MVENLREQQRATSHVLRTLARFQGPQPVFDAVVEAATRLCDAEYGALYIKEGDAFPVAAAGGAAVALIAFERENPLRAGRDTLVGRVALTREACHIPDTLADAEYAHPRRHDIGIRALLGVPVFVDDELIGILAVARNVPEAFADEHIDLLKTFADQAAIAIATARLIEAVERQLEQQHAIADVLRAVARSEGLEAVFAVAVDSATRLCRGDYGALYLKEGEVLKVVTQHYGQPGVFDYERENPHVIDRTTAIGRAALMRQVVHIPDTRADPDYSWGASGIMEYRELLAAPILLDGELIGAMNVVRVEPHGFAPEHIELMKTFADQAAIAIANARLVDSLEQQLEQQRAVSDVLGVVARSEGLESMFDAVVQAATRLCRAEYGQFSVADGDVLRMVGTYGAAPEVVQSERANPSARDRTTVVGRVAVTRDVVHIPDVLADPEYASPSQALGGMRAMLGVPIFLEDELIGVINVVRNEPGPFNDEHIGVVKTFADQAAIAIANARLLDAVERQKTELSRFVSPQVAELISSEEGQKLLAGHRGYITCLFCDLRNFTTFAETAAPEELLEVLRQYHQAVGELVPAYEGTLEHFAGDGLMVFFNDPIEIEEHELKAVGFALALRERFEHCAGGWRKREIDLGLGIGIAAGYATLGRIGFEGRYDYGALGPVSNLASRLSTEAQPGQILIAQRLYAAVEEQVEAERVGELELKGFGRRVTAYDVRGLR